MSESHTRSDLEPLATGSMRNVFFALRPDGSTLDSIAAAGDALAAAHGTKCGRRLKRDRLHLTLLYLGKFPAIPETYLQHAIEMGDAIDAPPFDLTLDMAGSFRSNDLPWWLGSSNISIALTALHRDLYAGMRSRSEAARGGASLTPHVTISRSNSEPLPDTPIAPIRWRVEEVCLIESVMGKRDFDIIKIWKLDENG